MVDKLVVLTIYYLQNSSVPETQIIHLNYIICCENLFSNQLGIELHIKFQVYINIIIIKKNTKHIIQKTKT